ncbi:MAG: hypothetical protein Q9214_005250 [Letrouitia sp. 1 TL-2023]
MDRVLALCNDAVNYSLHTTPSYESTALLDRFSLRLKRYEHRLFCSEANAAVNFWDFENGGSEFLHTQVKDVTGLKSHFRIAPVLEMKDPCCRFL